MAHESCRCKSSNNGDYFPVKETERERTIASLSMMFYIKIKCYPLQTRVYKICNSSSYILFCSCCGREVKKDRTLIHIKPFNL